MQGHLLAYNLELEKIVAIYPQKRMNWTSYDVLMLSFGV